MISGGIIIITNYQMAIKINIKEINKVVKKGKPEDAKELNLSKRNASELEDISFCKALQKIHLNENNLQKFDVIDKISILPTHIN